MRGRAIQVNAPRFGHRRTGLPCRNVGSGHQQHQEPLGRGQFPICPPFTGFILTVFYFVPMYFVLRRTAQLRNLQNPHLLPRPCHASSILYWSVRCISFLRSSSAQRSAQFAQFVVRSSEGIAQVLIGASGRPRRDGSFGSGGRSFHLSWQEQSITPLAFCRHRRGVCGQWRYRV